MSATEGWSNLGGQSRKWHYFKNGMSLCHKWGIWIDHELEEGKDDHPDNCRTCMKELAKIKAKETEDEA